MLSDRKIIQNFKVITKMDIGCDHRMVRARVQINKKLTRLKKIPKQKPLKLDPIASEKSVPSVQSELRNIFHALKDKEPNTTKMNKILKESMDTIQNDTKVHK